MQGVHEQRMRAKQLAYADPSETHRGLVRPGLLSGSMSEQTRLHGTESPLTPVRPPAVGAASWVSTGQRELPRGHLLSGSSSVLGLAHADDINAGHEGSASNDASRDASTSTSLLILPGDSVSQQRDGVTKHVCSLLCTDECIAARCHGTPSCASCLSQQRSGKQKHVLRSSGAHSARYNVADGHHGQAGL
jgi:hypothetical protein